MEREISTLNHIKAQQLDFSIARHYHHSLFFFYSNILCSWETCSVFNTTEVILSLSTTVIIVHGDKIHIKNQTFHTDLSCTVNENKKI